MTHVLTEGDVAAMVKEAASRGASYVQPVVDAITTPNAGGLQGYEDVLAVAALAEILRHRVERAAQSTPGLSGVLARLHRRVGEVLAVQARNEEVNGHG